jgi:hypothetical protein
LSSFPWRSYTRKKHEQIFLVQKLDTNTEKNTNNTVNNTVKNTNNTEHYTNITPQEKIRTTQNITPTQKKTRTTQNITPTQKKTRTTQNITPTQKKTRTNFPCPKVDMTSFGTRLLGKKNRQFFAIHTHEQRKLVKENVSQL